MIDQRIQLEADPSSPAAARAFVRQWLAGQGFSQIAPALELMTSEAVTNAVIHAGEPLEVSIEDRGDCVRVRVNDPVVAVPVARPPSPSAASGRGVAIIDALASRWGVVVDPPAGKQVWFEVPSPGR